MIRLSRVADEHLPDDIRQRVQVICSDGAKLCLKPQNQFDRILLDAPCSSERHVLSAPTYLEQWSPARIKSLAIAQWALLSSAYRMIRPDGYILYATCALSPEENDKVVSRLEKKFCDVEYISQLPLVPCNLGDFYAGELPEPEKTEKGFHVLPDKAKGAGPLYFALIHKKNLEEENAR